jgi:hypothetical protein
MCWAACWTIETPFFFVISLESRSRSSTFDLQNPQCPICQVSLNGQDMMTHIQHELDTIERTRQQYKYATRRSSHLTNGQNKVSYHLLLIHKLIIIDYVYQTIIITFSLDSPRKYN